MQAKFFHIFVSGMSGEHIAEFQDRYDAMDEYGDYEVYEWNVHADCPGYAVDFIEISIQD